MKIAQVPSIFGTIAPPIGSPVDIGSTIGRLLNIFLTFAALAAFAYMLWGAFDWIVSGGEKEKVDKARNKMTNAVVGIILIIAVLGLFNIIIGPILGISTATGGWKFNLPKIGP